MKYLLYVTPTNPELSSEIENINKQLIIILEKCGLTFDGQYSSLLQLREKVEQISPTLYRYIGVTVNSFEEAKEVSTYIDSKFTNLFVTVTSTNTLEDDMLNELVNSVGSKNKFRFLKNVNQFFLYMKKELENESILKSNKQAHTHVNPSPTWEEPSHANSHSNDTQLDKSVPSEPSQPNVHPTGQKPAKEETQRANEEVDESPIKQLKYHRIAQLQKQLFTDRPWELNKVIGVWSPLHRMGVTTFTVNFALYLAKHLIYTTVLEGLTNQPKLNVFLHRYTDIPNNWVSYSSLIQARKDIADARLMYKDVLFLPLSEQDVTLSWDNSLVRDYMTATRLVEVTLVDLPTGEMENYTQDAIQYLDELWILLDGSSKDVLAWVDYITNLKQKLDIPIHIILHRCYPFTKDQELANMLQLPILTKIPAMEEAVMQNHYEGEPLIENEHARPILLESFKIIGKHLTGKEIVRPSPPEPKQTKDKQKKKFFASILNRRKG